MKYMIHTYPGRKWYVDEFLLPSMLEQGVKKTDVIVWNDAEHKGNLVSCQESFRWCRDKYGHDERIWHLQDDVVISSRFKELTEKYTEPFQNGFCCEAWEPKNYNFAGPVISPLAWVSFQCVCIKNDLAANFADWVDEKREEKGSLYEAYIKFNKHDDVLFAHFLRSEYPELPVRNISPNIADHVDYLIGGSSLNDQRKGPDSQRSSWYWYEPDVIKDLERKLKERSEKDVSATPRRRSNDKPGQRADAKSRRKDRDGIHG